MLRSCDFAFYIIRGYLSAQTAFYSLNPNRDIPGPLAINLLI
jgi:hypothetical protein